MGYDSSQALGHEVGEGRRDGLQPDEALTRLPLLHHSLDSKMSRDTLHAASPWFLKGY
jgi:hypothetical protein